MREALFATIQEHEPWLSRFNRLEYCQSFEAYLERFAGVYREAVWAASDEVGLQRLAEELLSELEQDWKRRRFWERTNAKFQDKQMVIGYLTPMLLGLQDENCHRLAEILQAAWVARWPKDGYALGEYREIRNGFRNRIMGIELQDELLETEQDPFQKIL